MSKGFLFLAVCALFTISCGSGERPVTRLFPVKVGAQYGYIDRTGNMAIPPHFLKAACFSGGLALVFAADSLWGYVAEDGSYAITPSWGSATSFSEGLAFVAAADGAPSAIDKKGVVQFTLDSAASVENFSDGLAAFSVLTTGGEHWGFIDKQGKTMIAPAYGAIGYFSEGMCGVMNDSGQWGYINKKGETIIPFRYSNVYPFTGKHARVAVKGRWGIIDKQGNDVLTPQYADIDIDGDRYLVKTGDKWGWLDKEGKTIIAPQYSNAFPYSGSALAAVKQGDKWGYIDAAGKVVIQPQFTLAFVFDGDMALVQQKDKYGFIDKAGKFVMPPTFDNISLDYFVSSLARTSAYYSLKSNKNTPSIVAWRWLGSFYRLEYDDAKKLSTEDTRTMLASLSHLAGMVTDSSRKELDGVVPGIKEVKEDGDRAIVTYTMSDAPGKDQLLFLVRKEGRWLVQFSKNDLTDPKKADTASVQ